MKIWITNYNLAKQFIPQEPTIAVRVFDPGASTVPRDTAPWCDFPDDFWENCPQAPFSRHLYADVLEYSFTDNNPDAYSNDERRKTCIERCGNKLFTREQAADLIAEFKPYKDLPAALFHCNAGASRSVAIARAMVKLFDIKAEYQDNASRLVTNENLREFNGNSYVYRIICEVFSEMC